VLRRAEGPGSSRPVDARSAGRPHQRPALVTLMGGVLVPRIKRWHPISHDFNRDPQIIEARKKYGDWIGYAWQECLSIADRNDGIVPGTLDQIAGILAPISLQSYLKSAANRVRIFLESALNWGWIRVESDHIVIVNYGKYHRTQEQKPAPSGPDPTGPDLIKINTLVDDTEKLTVKDLVDSWNDCFGKALPQVIWPLSKGRHRKAAIRVKEHQNLDFWTQVFNNIEASDFLKGNGNGSWRCTFDFLIANDTNSIKIYEGAYANGQKNSYQQNRRF
jgi:hypothetical protein